MKRKFLTVILTTLLALSLTACKKQAKPEETDLSKYAEQAAIAEANSEFEPIHIIYTNDIHSYIYNVNTDNNNNETPGLRLSNIAAMRKDMIADGKNVILVDSGDEIQGDIYGAIDEGKSVINLMNACGFELATLGNHEFDYGINTMFQRVEEADYDFITCNFHALTGDSDPFAPSKIIEIDGKKIAFVGITTPETITSSTPTYFQDSKGEYIYTIDGVKNPEDLYKSVQKAVDDIKDEADYVIALAHTGIGIDEVNNKISSYDIIKNTNCIDAYIDAHSHSVVPMDMVANKDGKEIPLTQSGYYLNHIGQVLITSSGITTSLIETYENTDDSVKALEDEIENTVNEKMGEKEGVLTSKLYVNNPDDSNQRLIRSRELNIGDFTADSIYSYLNNNLKLDCDIAIINGGGIRNELNAGPVTLKDIKTIQPFGNMICLVNAKGQQIIDALEMGTTVIGEWDDEWNAPAENGGFMHVAGLKYTIDSTIPSTVVLDDDGMFKYVEGEYRVKDVQVYDRENGEYCPIDPNANYSLAGYNYILRNSGNGINMFVNDELIVDYIGMDYIIFSDYIQSFTKDGEYPSICTNNSPLRSYNNYLLDYENPYGAGRINIILNDKK